MSWFLLVMSRHYAYATGQRWMFFVVAEWRFSFVVNHFSVNQLTLTCQKFKDIFEACTPF